MGENLLYHRLFIYETDDAHFARAFRARQWINFPDFLDALTPHQLWYSLWLVVSDIDDFAVFYGFTLPFSHLFFPLFLFLSVPAHSIRVPAIHPSQLKIRLRNMLRY
jgi:hypothetical protein